MTSFIDENSANNTPFPGKLKGSPLKYQLHARNIISPSDLGQYHMARWPSGLRRNVKVSLIHKHRASVVFGRGFESHSCHILFLFEEHHVGLIQSSPRCDIESLMFNFFLQYNVGA